MVKNTIKLKGSCDTLMKMLLPKMGVRDGEQALVQLCDVVWVMACASNPTLPPNLVVLQLTPSYDLRGL